MSWPWHIHRWTEVRRRVVAPARHFKFGGGFWSEAASDGLYGYTLIEQRCEVCGRVRVEKFNGAMGDADLQLGNVRTGRSDA